MAILLSLRRKKAIIRPLYKSGKCAADLKSCCPILLLPTLGKLFENPTKTVWISQETLNSSSGYEDYQVLLQRF